MNLREKKKFKDYIHNQQTGLWSTLKFGGRGEDAQEANYHEICGLLDENGIASNAPKNIDEAADIIKEVMNRLVLEYKKPDQDVAIKLLKDLEGGSTDVKAVIDGIDVRLDTDQNKHQHPKVPIGTRQKGGGNRFVETCNAQWHRQTTLAHMANWAKGLDLKEGQRQFHGQATPVNQIHYEGYCLLAKGQKYVLFHCYPSDSNKDLKL